LFKRELRSKFKVIAVSFLIAIATGSLVWVATGLIGGWNLVADYWLRQLWGTAVGGRGTVQAGDSFIFFGIFKSHYFPWNILLLFSLAWSVWKARWREETFLIPAFAAGIVVVVISSISFKYGHYFTPAYPFLAILAARSLAAWLSAVEAGVYRGFTVFVMLFITMLLCTPVSTAPESFPALKKFMALIIHEGLNEGGKPEINASKCEEKVLYVDGYQPYGGIADYTALINFYTARNVISSNCADAAMLAKRLDIGWIIVSGQNFLTCLDKEARETFSNIFLFGNQFLLSRHGKARPNLPDLDDKLSVNDLTPSEFELQAVSECGTASLPKDRYHAYLGDK
ncbi:MAG: hypothetical protein AABZ06_09665, partial [Bdellovibrionota bacterium]